MVWHTIQWQLAVLRWTGRPKESEMWSVVYHMVAIQLASYELATMVVVVKPC
jgi:hypothetical protein